MKNSFEVRCLTKDIQSVEAKLWSWNEVESLASVREKKCKQGDVTTIIINCTSSDALDEVKNRLSSFPEIMRETKNPSQGKNTKTKQHKWVDITAEVLEGIPHAKDLALHVWNEKKKGEGEKRSNQNGGRGRGGGGRRGPNGQGSGRYQRGQGQHRRPYNGGSDGGFNTFQRMPYVTASVAYIDNVPFGVTNTCLMDTVSPFGRVIDVNRFENMVMVCYDSQEAVVKCIQALNGKKIEDNVVTVSSGTARIPEGVLFSLPA